jgi:hypothetical protein
MVSADRSDAENRKGPDTNSGKITDAPRVGVTAE